MTSNRREKRAARALMELKGINYTSALRQVRDHDAGYQATRALRAQVMSASVPVLDRLQGVPLEAAGDLLSVNIYGVRDAVVQSIELRQSTIEWLTTTSPGASPHTLDVHSKAELVWEGRLNLAHGQALIDAGLAEFIDADLGDGSSLVKITHPKQSGRTSQQRSRQTARRSTSSTSSRSGPEPCISGF